MASHLFKLLLFIVVLSSTAIADSLYKVPITGNYRSAAELLLDRSPSTNRLTTLSEPLTFSGGARGLGAVTLIFTERWNQNWSSSFTYGESTVEDNRPILLLQGRAQGAGFRGDASAPAAGSLFQTASGKWRYTFSFAKRQRTTGRPTFYQMRGELNELPDDWSEHEFRFKRAWTTLLEAGNCGTELYQLANAVTSPVTPGAFESAAISTENATKILEVSTEADFEFYSDYGTGTDTNQTIASILNEIDTIYSNDLGITIDIKEQTAQASASQPYTTTNSTNLLNQFEQQIISRGHLSGDVNHLFTGKSLQSGVLGVAYVGGVCVGRFDSNFFATGLSSVPSLLSIMHLVVAHEIGHNLGAFHDSSTVDSNGNPTIMFPSLDPAALPGEFSAKSRSDIDTVLAERSCLAPVPTATPTPDPSATPTPTPTATPDDPGGGGNNGGGGGGFEDQPDNTPAPALTLAANLERSGAFSLDISTAELVPLCSVEVRASNKRRRVSAGTLLARYTVSEMSRRFTATLDRKAKRLKSGRQPKVFLTAYQSCTNRTSSESNVIRLRPSRIKTKRKTSVRRWIQLLADNIQ